MRGSSRALQIWGKAVQLLPVAKRWPLPGAFLWIDAQLVSFISGQFQPRWRDRLWDVGRTPKSPQEWRFGFCQKCEQIGGEVRGRAFSEWKRGASLSL